MRRWQGVQGVSATDEFAALIEATEVMKQVLESVREEPAHLLELICREHTKTGLPVPDHRLYFVGCMGEAALKALISAGMVSRHSGGPLALYTYEPTADGIGWCERLNG